MTFELHLDESLRMNMRRLIREQLEGALEVIRDSDEQSTDEQVHSVRKSFKRMRAVMRLVRHEIGKKAYHAENRRFREAGRPLSEVRDAKVLVDSLEELAAKYNESETKDAIEAAHELLVAHKREIRSCIQDQALDAAAECTEKALAIGWDDLRGRKRRLARGLCDVYKTGRAAFRRAKNARSVESFHEWRKQVKYLRHQLEIFAPLSRKVLGHLAESANELGELLGRDHDLAVLGCKLVETQNSELPVMTPIERIIVQERNALQAEALAKGKRLYREPTKEFSSRVYGYLKRHTTKRRVTAARCK